jgi:Tfp pilus assembly protein PilV
MIVHRADERGFGVIEALVSLTLFAVVAAALSASTIGGVKANHTSKHLGIASALVYDKIEQLRSLNPGSADMAPGSYNDPRNPMNALGATSGPAGEKIYSRNWVVTPNTPRPGVSQVKITVSWNNPEPASVQAITYICSSAGCAI